MSTITTPSYGQVNDSNSGDVIFNISLLCTTPAYESVVVKVQDEFDTKLATRQTTSNTNFNWGH